MDFRQLRRKYIETQQKLHDLYLITQHTINETQLPIWYRHAKTIISDIDEIVNTGIPIETEEEFEEMINDIIKDEHINEATYRFASDMKNLENRLNKQLSFADEQAQLTHRDQAYMQLAYIPLFLNNLIELEYLRPMQRMNYIFNALDYMAERIVV